MTDNVNLGRRNFLTGSGVQIAFSNSEKGYRLELSDQCLTYRNIVCQTCRDTCEPNAIRFPPRLGQSARPSIDAQRCTGCGDCVNACPASALSLNHG
ncbi:MAG: 4Fe-4S dicluster domain-containing protein [Woeseiaceae bacterium]